MPDASRPSRMVHRSATSSERLGLISDSAWRLYFLLVFNQDDEGCYPWTPTMIRALIVGTVWTPEKAAELLTELVRTELVSSTYSVRTESLESKNSPPNIVTIRRGAELNGIPKSGSPKWKEPRRYATDDSTYLVRTGYVLSTDSKVSEGKVSEGKVEEGADAPSPLSEIPKTLPKTTRSRSASSSDPLVPETMKGLELLRGYPPPNYAAEAAAIKWMLAHGLSKTDILACYTSLKLDSFWQIRPLTMNSVKKAIGEWVKNGRPNTPLPNPNGPIPSSRTSRVDKLPDPSEYGKEGKW